MYRRLAVLFLLMSLVACGTQQAPQGAVSVVTLAPEDGAVAVTPDATVIAAFDRAIDASTLASRFTLSHQGQAVEGTVGYAQATRTARFTPDAELAEGLYTAALASGIRAVDGSVLTAGRSWSFVVAEAAPGDPQNGAPPPPPPGPTDPDDPTEHDVELRAAFLSPTPNKRLAGLVSVELDVEAEEGIRRAELFVDGEGGAVRAARWDMDPAAAPVLRETLSASISTVDFETGEYALRVVLEDRAGNIVEQMLVVEFLTPFLITHPTDGESVGAGRQIVAVTIGVNGTILDDYDVTSIDLYINGSRYAAGIPVDDDATSTRLIVYPWDTTDPGLGGHPVDASGDRALTARVYFVDPVTDTVRNEFTPGVIVDYQP